jgi:hypothetical protein
MRSLCSGTRISRVVLTVRRPAAWQLGQAIHGTRAPIAPEPCCLPRGRAAARMPVVSTQQWVRLLVGNGVLRWRTVEAHRTVLVVVHNVTAATRLLDVLPLWCTDIRIQTVFTCIGSSAFTTGTTEFLAKYGATPVPWEEAVRVEFDLVISASYGGPLHEVHAPLIVVPHGMGYNKYLPETGNRKPETGNRFLVFLSRG